MLPRLIKSVLIVFALCVAGCSDRVELHRQLSEQDANEVIAELADKQVRAQKNPTKNGVSVSVNTQDISRAVNVLEAAGLPRATRSTLGEIFRKEGVISTPLEERARYIYALSQELEATLSKIDGVIVARVHVVLPERIAPGEPVQPASASVFIKHNSRLDPDSIQSRVRRLVASSIPGMPVLGQCFDDQAYGTQRYPFTGQALQYAGESGKGHDALQLLHQFRLALLEPGENGFALLNT